MNIVLHGIQHLNVKRANARSELGSLTEDDLQRTYKVILSNPPASPGYAPRIPSVAKARVRMGHVWFYEVCNNGYDPYKTVSGSLPETPEQNDIPDLF